MEAHEPAFTPRMRSPELMRRSDSALIVVDVQEKLAPHVQNTASLERNIRRLIRGAKLLQVPIVGTEQYPKGLGPTLPSISCDLGVPVEKLSFSCGEIIAQANSLRDRKILRLLLVGIETHVCIMQSALDLLSDGFRVYVAVDAVSSRSAIDHDVGLKRMDSTGVTLVTTEMALFEWMETADAPEFRAFSRLIREQAN